MILYQFGFLIENELLCQLEVLKKKVIKTIIIKQFKALWAVKFHSLKRPQEYALLLNVSSVYLNEAVKKTTGYKCLCTEKRFNGNA